ncbi:phospho-acceptor domain-containing protein [Anaerobacterium chartisolvens]|uniref:histidine kinase n=1 Tax=Anaerobacterium chartisolvens TaxID=1297424 RepID=A0A369B9I7_9FIRM|nr:HAMP domain-containing sensor histidine kinase [Anaerobacterium chartisolvens]RCX17187.1 phospho-acceptor domain-containing protein [Anaerobacterium chartisolvens]
MRLSIKVKLPLIVFAVFILNILLLIIFFRMSSISTLRDDFKAYINNIMKTSGIVMEGIEEYYPDNLKIKEFIAGICHEKNVSVLVRDTGQQIVFASDEREKGVFKYNTKDIVSIDGKVVYTVEIGHSFTFLKSIINNTNVVIFEVIILFTSGLLLVLYLHFKIVKPLEILQRSLGTVNNYNNKLSLKFKQDDEIGELYKNFEDMVQRLEMSQSQQIEMISSISHDLKTPLTSVMGYVERLMGSVKMPEEKRQEYYRIIYKKSQDIEKLVEDFSDYTKNEADCKKLKKEKVSVKEFFDSICREYFIELQSYNAEFKTYCAVNDNAVMEVDDKKIRRVFANLISNSLKYAQAPVVIKASCEIKGDQVVFAVEDNGKGVPEEELSSIFNKFYRLDKSRSPERGGSGLGLAICSSIVKSHMGKIWAYNVEHGGLGVSFAVEIQRESP